MSKEFNDFMHDQIIAISKAGAYDAIAPKMAELQAENDRLRAAYTEQITAREKAEDRVKYLENLIAEYTSKMKANLSGPKVDKFLKDQLTDPNDIKDINI